MILFGLVYHGNPMNPPTSLLFIVTLWWTNIAMERSTIF